MATKEKPLSLSDFEEGSSLLDTAENELNQAEEDEKIKAGEEGEEEEEEEEEEKETSPKQKKKTRPKQGPKKKAEALAEEEEEEDEEKKEVVDGEDPDLQKSKDPEPDTAEQFFEEVVKITGQDVDVDYGNVDPLTPQGIALREKAVREQALDTFLEEVKDKYPKIHQALAHAANGGDPAELFTVTTSRDYSKITLTDGDDELAKDLLKEYYRSRGVKSEARIAKMIEADEESEGGLVKEAQGALQELQAEQETKRTKLLEEQSRLAKEQKKRDETLVAAVDETLENRVLGGFRIPDRAEAQQFRKFVLEGVRRADEGKYQLVIPLDPNNIAQALQYYYFQFKKGDLSKIIQQKAATMNAEKLKLKLRAEAGKPQGSSLEEKNTKLSLKDF